MRYLLVLFCAAVFVSCGNKKEDTGKTEASAADKFVQQLTEKADKNPDNLQYRMDLVNALDSLERYREALYQMNLYIRKDSVSDQPWFKKGQLEEKAKDTAAAIRSYTNSININPSIGARLYLANLYAEMRNDTALLLITWVTRENQDDRTLAECDFIAGVYNARRKDTRTAIQLFTRCITHERQYMEAYMEIGFIYYEQKNYSEALKIFQLASSVNGRYADAFYWQAKTYEAMGKTQEAINMYQESLNLDPGIKEAKDAVGRLNGTKS